jgi:hypothetical protein
MADFSKAIDLNSDDGVAYWYRGDVERLLHLPTYCGDYYKAEELGVAQAVISRKKYCN